MIVITGASKGIGNYLFEKYLSQNKAVVGTYLNSLPKNLNQYYYKLDVTDFNDTNNFIQSKVDILDNIILINCAGINYNSFLHKSDHIKWEQVFKTNVLGTYNMIRSILPIMREQKFGRIINFSSVVALKPTPGVSAYAASKSALWGLARSVAIENAEFNITINNINMGYSKLGMINEVPTNYLNSIISEIPSKKLCDSIDILNTVDYLINTSYLTGSSIDLSGGIV
jgi:NAD(P)-dependent dehydrogenase (short-subunit alcohol dehydrogenase family)